MCSALAHLAHYSREHQPRTRDASLPGTIRLYRLLAQEALHENCIEIASFRRAPVHVCLATCGKAQAISPHATHGYCRVVVQRSQKHNTTHSLLLRPPSAFPHRASEDDPWSHQQPFWGCATLYTGARRARTPQKETP